MTNLTLNEQTAFIVGNGLSRKDFDLNRLKGVGTVYGCNALYRTFTPDYELPDYLVAIDEPIKKEIKKSPFPQDRVIFPAEDECYESAEYRDNPRNRSNAGMNAMQEAIRHGKDQLIMLGFDFMLDMPIAIDNMYDGTPCYGPETRTNEVFSEMRVHYFDWFAQKNLDTDFIFIYPRMDEMRIYAVNADNVNGCYYDQLEELL